MRLILKNVNKDLKYAQKQLESFERILAIIKQSNIESLINRLQSSYLYSHVGGDKINLKNNLNQCLASLNRKINNYKESMEYALKMKKT